jgi:hypothetical protein
MKSAAKMHAPKPKTKKVLIEDAAEKKIMDVEEKQKAENYAEKKTQLNSTTGKLKSNTSNTSSRAERRVARKVAIQEEKAKLKAEVKAAEAAESAAAITAAEKIQGETTKTTPSPSDSQPKIVISSPTDALAAVQKISSIATEIAAQTKQSKPMSKIVAKQTQELNDINAKITDIEAIKSSDPTKPLPPETQLQLNTLKQEKVDKTKSIEEQKIKQTAKQTAKKEAKQKSANAMTEEQKTQKAVNNAFTKNIFADISKNSQEIAKIEGQIGILSETKNVSKKEAKQIIKQIEKLNKNKGVLEDSLYAKKIAIGAQLTPGQRLKLLSNNARRNSRKTLKTGSNNPVKTNSEFNKIISNTNKTPKPVAQVALETAQQALKNNVVSKQFIQSNNSEKVKTKEEIELKQTYDKKFSKLEKRRNKYTKALEKERVREEKFYAKNKHNPRAKYKRSLFSRLFRRSNKKLTKLLEIADKNLERTGNRFKAESAKLSIIQKENIEGQKLAKMQSARKVKAEEIKAIMTEITESKLAAGENPLDIKRKDIKKEAKEIRKERNKEIKEAAKDYKNTEEYAQIKYQRKIARKLEKRGIKEGKAKEIAGLGTAVNLTT